MSRDALRRCKLERCGGPIPVTARADAEFCRPEHKSAWHNEQRRSSDTTAKRLDPASDAESPSIAQIRAEQERAKAHWSAIVHEGIVEALRERGEFHADDLIELGIPDEHRNVIGAQVAGVVGKRWMKKTGWRRSTAPSRHGNGAWIFELTEKGQEAIAGLGAGRGDDSRKESLLEPPDVEAGAEPGDASDVLAELTVAETRLFDGAVPTGMSSAFNPDNP